MSGRPPHARPRPTGCSTSASTDSIRQTFSSLLVHTPQRTARWPLPWTFSTFDYRTLCRLLWEQGGDATFETAKVDGRTGSVVHTDRGDVPRRLIVDGLGWRRVLGAGANVQPPDAPLSRGLEVHPARPRRRPRAVARPPLHRPGLRLVVPGRDELRIGVGSFDPRLHVKEPTVQLAADVEAEAVRFQGNWIPHRLRPATEDGVFFVGDSAGHCLPLTAEGIRRRCTSASPAGASCARCSKGRQDALTHPAPIPRVLSRAQLQFNCMYARPAVVRRLHGPADGLLVRNVRKAPGAGSASGTTSTSRLRLRRCRRPERSAAVVQAAAWRRRT